MHLDRTTKKIFSHFEIQITKAPYFPTMWVEGEQEIYVWDGETFPID